VLAYVNALQVQQRAQLLAIKLKRGVAPVLMSVPEGIAHLVSGQCRVCQSITARKTTALATILNVMDGPSSALTGTTLSVTRNLLQTASAMALAIMAGVALPPNRRRRLSYVLFFDGDVFPSVPADISVELWQGSNAEISECCRSALRRSVDRVWFMRFNDLGQGESRIARLFYELRENAVNEHHWLWRFIEIGLGRTSIFGCIELGVEDSMERQGTLALTVGPMKSPRYVIELLAKAFVANSTIEFLVTVEGRQREMKC